MSSCKIIIPCYNEASRLNTEAFSRAISEDKRIHFCFVDDGSRDQTASILTDLVRRNPLRLSLIQLRSNSGKAEAVRQGLLAHAQSGCDFVGYWDADLATPLNVVTQMLDRLIDEPRLDGMIGSRIRRLGANVERSSWRHYSGRIFGTMASLAIGLPVYDTQCGAKMFRVRPWLHHAYSSPFRNRWIFDVELLSRYVAHCHSSRLEPAIYELPLLQWKDIQGSKLRMTDGVKAFVALSVLAWRHRLSLHSAQVAGRWAWQEN